MGTSTANKSPPASFQMNHTCSLLAPISLSSKRVLYRPFCWLCWSRRQDVCGWNKHRGRGYIFSQAERKRHQKQRFPHERRRGSLCESICSTALLINVTQWEGPGWLAAAPPSTGSSAATLTLKTTVWPCSSAEISEAGHVYEKLYRAKDDHWH